MQTMIGKKIKDIELISEIGGGGFGKVYKGIHQPSQTPFAVKILPIEWIQNEENIQAFEKEVTALLECQHPSILKLENFGFDKNIGAFLITEWLEGRTLNQIWRSHPPFPTEWVLFLFEPFLAAVGTAHQKGYIHRDLKPENTILVPLSSGKTWVKILDFGIANLMQSTSKSDETFTVGTPNYMAPEQVEGKSELFCPATDLYACGIIFAELLTGRQMFKAPTHSETMELHLLCKPPTLREMNPDLAFSPAIEAFVAKALQKDPTNRFQSASEMWEAMKKACQTIPIPLDWSEIGKNIQEYQQNKKAQQKVPIHYKPTDDVLEKKQKEKKWGLLVGVCMAVGILLALWFLFFKANNLTSLPSKKKVKIMQFEETTSPKKVTQP